LRLLTDRQRQFVLKHVVEGKTRTAAAREAGFASPKTYQTRLMRDPKVVAAVKEEIDKRFLAGAVLGVSVLFEIAQDKDHKDRLKAGRELLAHAGLAPVIEQKISVERSDMSAEAVRAEIRLLMAKLGPPAVRLLESAGLMDAEFSEVGA
jgi:phage terminase small subunit